LNLLHTRPDLDVKEQILSVFGNIAGNSVQDRDHVLQMGVMQYIVNTITILEKPNLPLLRAATWTISTLCRKKPYPDYDNISPALPILADFLNHNDAGVMENSCWAFSCIAARSDNRCQAIIDVKVLPRMTELLSHSVPSVRRAALSTIGFIVSGNDLQTQAVLNCNPLPSIAQLCHHALQIIRKDAIWTVSNFAAGNQTQIQALINANFIPSVIDMLKQPDVTFDIKNEIVWIIYNMATGGNTDQVTFLVDCGAIPGLIDLIISTLAKVAVEALYNIIDSSGDNKPIYAGYIKEVGLEKLESLQTDNEGIKKSVHKLLDELKKY
jgi:importin subunit alpha-1